MKKIVFVFLLLISFGLTEAGRVQDDLDRIQALFRADMDAAAKAALELKEEYEWRNNRYGLMKVHFILGYIQRKKGVLDEAIKHYLEAIWHGETAPERYSEDLIGLYMNCGVIYRTSGHYDLAIECYEKGIDLAKMDAKLLEKVEELTLYLLELKKENEMIKEELKALKTK